MQARSWSSSRRFSRNDSQRRRALSLELLEIRNLFSSTPLYYMVDGQRIELKPSSHEYAVQVSGDGKATVGSLNGAFGGLSGFSTEEKLKENVWRVSKLAGDAWSSQDVITSDSADLPSGVDWIAPTYTVVSSGATVAVLDEAVVALNSGVRPEDVFVKEEIVSFRPLLGTPDQFVVTLPKGGNTTLEYAIAIAENPQVAWATPNFYRNMTRSFVPNDTLFPNQWHLNNTGSQIADAIAGADIKAVGAWNLSTGTGVTIAVLDDGIERTHPDLAANIFVNPGEIPGDGIDNDGNGYTDDVSGWSFANNSPNPSVGSNDRHGTSVAGVAAGVGHNSLGVAGSAFNAKILPVQMFNGSSYVGDASTASAIYYAAGRTANGLGTWNAAQVINASWGGGAPNSALNAAFTWANNVARGGKGVASFIASGNDRSSSVSYPASLSATISGVMAVGASNQQDMRSEYSNYGSALDFVAPSSDIDAPVTGGITTTDRSGSAGYNIGDYTNNTVANGFGGTSSASPLATGVGALLVSFNPNLTAAQVKQTLRSTADKVGGVVYDSNGFNSQYGYGRINAFAALQTLGMQVIGTTPANGTTVSAPLALVGGYRADFNFSYDQDAGDIDLTKVAVNGISPTGFTVIDSDTLQFNFASNPIIGQGLQTFTIDAGAVKRQSNGELNAAYAGTFRYDNLALAVTSTSPTASTVITMPFTTLDLNFNEPILASSVQPADFAVNLGNVVGASLLDADTIRLTLGGLTGEGTLAVSLAAGAITDNFGNGNVAFSGGYILDFGTVAYPVPLVAKAPLGSLVYDRTVEGTIGFAGDADTFTISLDAGQRISVLLSPSDSTLQPTVVVRGPGNVLLGSATAAGAGQRALLNTLPAATAGTYTVIVSGAGGTTGGYSVQLTLNAALEREGLLGGESNNTLATAQNINGAFITLAGTASRAAVLGALAAPPVVDFENSVLPASFSTYTSDTTSGRILVAPPPAPSSYPGNSSAYALLMDNGVDDGTYVLNEAVYTVDLTGVTQANLVFKHANFDDEGESLPQDFSGHYNGDGVSISANGVNWRTILSAPSNTNWLTTTIDLAAAAAAAGMTLGPNFRIKFQQYDNFAIGADGRGFDDIAIQVPDTDAYSFSLNQGDTATVVLEGLTGTAASFQLRDAGNTLLALSAAGPTNVDQAVSNFKATAAGVNTYYVVVPANTAYNLAVTRNAAFDAESNNAFAIAQPIVGVGGVLGAIEPELSPTKTVTFTELPAQPANGVSVNGVTFGYTVGGVASTDATFGGEGPGTTLHTAPPQLEGGTAGVLSMDFGTPTNSLQFGYLLSVTGPVSGAGTVQLYDAANVLFATRTINTVTPPGFTFSEALFSETSATPIKRAVVTPNGAVAARFVIDNVQFTRGAGAAGNDWYLMSVNAGDNLTLTTSTPADGSGGFVNTLNPKIELYSHSGVLVATGVALGDGRNEQILHTATESGQYRVRVLGESNSTGEYFVSIGGNTGTAQPFQVTSSNPVNGAVLLASPTIYTVDLNDAVLVTSVQASDLKVNGTNATAVTVVDGDTLAFTLPGGLPSGTHTVTIATSDILDVQGTPIQAFSATFAVDGTAPQVVATSVAPNSILAPGNLTYQVTFSEPMRISNLNSADFALRGNLRAVDYAASTFSFNAAGTVLTLGYTGLPDDDYTLKLFAGSSGGTNFTDVAGNALDGEFTGTFPSGNGVAGGNFVVGFDMDLVTETFPALTPKNPLGSLIYNGSLMSTIAFLGDVDSFNLNIDPNQTISVIVTPITAGLQPRVELFSPANASLGSASAGAPGQVTGIQTLTTTSGGIYRIEVSGLSGSQGQYSVQVILNGALENEGKIDGSTNNTAATAQNINGSFISLGTSSAHAQRGAVLGTTDAAAGGAPIAEVEPNNSRVSAQNLESATWSLAVNSNITNSTTVPHVTINGTGDGTFDYYTFQVTTAGSVGYFDIDSANFDTTLFLFNSTGVLLTSNDDSGNDTGSSSSLDSFISYTFATTGTYVIAVGEYVSSASGGVVSGNPPDSGDAYTLHVSVANHVSSATMDFYRFDVAAGQRVSLALTNLTTGNVDVQLIGQNGTTVLATGVGGATNLNEVIQNFLIGSAGTYFARVSGNAGVEYSLVVTKDAVFDTEANNTRMTAQDVTGSQGAIGHLQTQVLTAYDFENGQQGWTINNNMIGTGTAAGLWNLTTRRATDANHSPVTSFWYGNPATGNYDTGSRNAGEIVSPSFVVQSDTNISFKYFLDTEGGVTYDKATVQVSTNGGASWTTVLNPLLESSVFTSASASLASYAGQTAQVRFVFDTIDSTLNSFEGWYVDDITINEAPDDDWYKVTLAADQTVVDVETRTPADGTGQFSNTLNPRIQFFDSAGTDITPTVTILPDGRNEKFTATGLIPGQTYYVKVTAQSGPLGEYFVGIKPLRAPAVTVAKDDGDWGFQLNGPGWSVQTGTGHQNDYRLHPVSAPSSATNVARWVVTPPGPMAEVFVSWVARPTNATNATYKIYDGTTLRGTVVIDQTRSPNDALLYGTTNAKSLGTFAFNTKQMRVELSTLGANGDLVADGVFSRPVISVPTTTSPAAPVAASRTTTQSTSDTNQTTLKAEISPATQQTVQVPNTALPTRLSARDALFALMATRPLPLARAGQTVGSSEWIDDLLRDDSDPAKQGQLVTTKDANPKLRRGR